MPFNSLLKIVVVYHRKYPMFLGMKIRPDIYVPILAGKDSMSKDINPFFNGMLVDNVGDNISWLNPYLNEFTAMYWIWKHPEAIDNPEFIGFHHYRRYFNPKDIDEVFNGKIVVNEEQEAMEEVNALSYFFGLQMEVNIKRIMYAFFNKDKEHIHKWFLEFITKTEQYNREMYVCPWFIFDMFMKYMTNMLPFLARYIGYGYNSEIFYRNISYIVECLVGFFFYCIEQSNICPLHKTRYEVFAPEGY